MDLPAGSMRVVAIASLLPQEADPQTAAVMPGAVSGEISVVTLEYLPRPSLEPMVDRPRIVRRTGCLASREFDWTRLISRCFADSIGSSSGLAYAEEEAAASSERRRKRATTRCYLPLSRGSRVSRRPSPNIFTLK